MSQASRRVKDKIRNDKKLERKIAKIEKKIKCVKNEDLTPLFLTPLFPPIYFFKRAINLLIFSSIAFLIFTLRYKSPQRPPPFPSVPIPVSRICCPS